ncbi:MAG: hypothetical protein QM688_05615 [Sphingomonas bacterium]
MPTSDTYTQRHSRRFSDELIEDARKLFQERTDRKLTAEDSRQMLENLTGFFSVLLDMDRAKARREAGGGYGKDDSDESH